MLEMVHYILRLIITMKLVIYEAILNGARGLGSTVSSPSGVWAEPQQKSNLMHFSLKI